MWSITSGAGDCQLVQDKPWCVEDSGGGGGESGNYGGSEDCTMTALIPMSVSFVGTFSTESVSFDYLQLGQSPNTKWGGSTGPSNVEMAAGDTMVRSPARSHTHMHAASIQGYPLHALSSRAPLLASLRLSHDRHGIQTRTETTRAGSSAVRCSLHRHLHRQARHHRHHRHHLHRHHHPRHQGLRTSRQWSPATVKSLA